MTEQIPTSAQVGADGAVTLFVDGRAQSLRAPDLAGARSLLVEKLVHHAGQRQQTVTATVSEPGGLFTLQVSPDGAIAQSAAHAIAPFDSEPAVRNADGHPLTIPTPPSPQEAPAGASADHWGPPGVAGAPQAPAPSAATPQGSDAVGPTEVAAPGVSAASSPSTALEDTLDRAPWAPPTEPARQGATGPSSGRRAAVPAEPIQPAEHTLTAPAQPSYPAAQPAQHADGTTSYPTSQPAPQAQAGQPQPAHAQLGDPARQMTRREIRQSFLTVEQIEPPATKGMRGFLSRAGIKTAPSAGERAEREDLHAVSQHWPGVRTVAIVNGKGGASKTPTTALLAAVFARHSGAATIAWDNNETRGTLGWRTEQGKHEHTVLDLIPQAQRLLDPGARAGDISHYVHHQATDKYDVLRSNPNLLSAEQRISDHDVDKLHDVLGRYYRLIFVDSGNDESASHWLRMIEKADQLVVPTIARPEHAEAGALLLEALTQRGGRSAELAQRAVVIVSQAREKDANPSAAEIAQGFEGWVGAVRTIPYDPAMVENVLRLEALRPATQRAWLAAAAAVSRGL